MTASGDQHFDDYDMFWRRDRTATRSSADSSRWILEEAPGHPSYDSFGAIRAVDKILAAQPLKVPVMWS